MGCQQHAWPAHAPERVEAEVNYIRDSGERPVAYTYPAPAGTPQRSALLQPTRVAIRNARLLAQPASLEREGFQLVREASAVGDFEDEAQVRERYYPESIALLRRLTGAAEAVIFDHTLRVDQAGREERGLREPVRYVHNDQTLRSAPLALLDARSLAFDDLVASDLVYRDKVGETYSVKPNPEHRWYYYPHLLPEEALLLKIYDSREDAQARLGAHTAFDDPCTPADAPPRQSIELRCLLFFDE